MQRSFVDWPQEPDAYLASLLGEERAVQLNPLRRYANARIAMSAGGDASYAYPDSVLWVQRACNYSVPEQSLTVREALRLCTYNGTWTTLDELERGSLEIGKVADTAVLSENPYEMAPEDLGRLRVEGLILGGRPYERQKQGIVSAVMRGALGRWCIFGMLVMFVFPTVKC